MVFNVLEQKYKCNCGRGTAELVVPGILDKINELAEWDLIHFPRTKQHDVEIEGETVPIYVEDRNFLGTNPKLEPGNCILIGGQVIAFDSPDRIVLVVTETGGKSLDRIYKECIKPEWELVNDINNIVEFTYTDEISEDDEKELTETLPIDFSYYKVWKNLYLNGEEKKILINIDNGFFITKLIFDKWEIRYNETDWSSKDDLDLLEYIVMGILGWFCRFSPRNNSWIDHEEKEKKFIEKEIERLIEEKKEKGGTL